MKHGGIENKDKGRETYIADIWKEREKQRERERERERSL
jgi:hypothetical protein